MVSLCVFTKQNTYLMSKYMGMNDKRAPGEEVKRIAEEY